MYFGRAKFVALELTQGNKNMISLTQKKGSSREAFFQEIG